MKNPLLGEETQVETPEMNVPEGTTPENEPQTDAEKAELKRKLDGSTQEAHYLKQVNEVYKDPFKFVEIYESSPKVAQKMIDKEGWDEPDAETAYNRLKAGMQAKWVQPSTGIAPEEKALRLYKAEQAKEKLDELLEKSSIDVSTEAGKKFMKKYAELVGDRELDSKGVVNFFSDTTKLVSGVADLEAEYNENLKGMPGIGMWARPSTKEQFQFPVNKPKSLKDSRSRQK